MFAKGQQQQSTNGAPTKFRKPMPNFTQEVANASFSQRSNDFELMRTNSPKYDGKARLSGKVSPSRDFGFSSSQRASLMQSMEAGLGRSLINLRN